MTSSSSRRGAFAAAGRSRAQRPDGQAPPEPGARAIRTRPVQTTVAVAPDDYQYLVQTATRLAAEIGAVTLHRNRVWGALLAELREDPELYERVRARLEAEAD